MPKNINQLKSFDKTKIWTHSLSPQLRLILLKQIQSVDFNITITKYTLSFIVLIFTLALIILFCHNDLIYFCNKIRLVEKPLILIKTKVKDKGMTVKL